MKTLIAIPTHDNVPVMFVKTFIDLIKPEGTTYSIIPGTLIYEARNLIAQKAVENNFDAVLWLDSDMIVPRDALVRLAEDMEEHRADLVTALYFRRKPPTNPVISNDFYWRVEDDGSVKTGATSYVDYPRNAVFPVNGMVFGCCMTSGKLLKAMVDAYGSPFTPLMGIGEDYAFCYRAGKAGFKLLCDSRVKCGHIGSMVFDERAFMAQMYAKYTRQETALKHFPGGSKTCSNCEYGRSTVCNDHGEPIIKPETQSCPEWRERIKREYET